MSQNKNKIAIFPPLNMIIMKLYCMVRPPPPPPSIDFGPHDFASFNLVFSDYSLYSTGFRALMSVDSIKFHGKLISGIHPEEPAVCTVR